MIAKNQKSSLSQTMAFYGVKLQVKDCLSNTEELLMRLWIKHTCLWKTSETCLFLEINQSKNKVNFVSSPRFLDAYTIYWFHGLFKVLGLVLDDLCGLIFVLRFIVFCLVSLKLLQMDFFSFWKNNYSTFFLDDQRAWSIQDSPYSAPMWLSKNIAWKDFKTFIGYIQFAENVFQQNNLRK